jgi:hypothetical protein
LWPKKNCPSSLQKYIVSSHFSFSLAAALAPQAKINES